MYRPCGARFYRTGEGGTEPFRHKRVPLDLISSSTAVRSVRIGIDLGGTKIEGIALEGSSELARLRTDTPRDN